MSEAPPLPPPPPADSAPPPPAPEPAGGARPTTTAAFLRSRWSWVFASAVVAVALIVALAGGDKGVPGGGDTRRFGDSAADPVPYDGRSPALTPGRAERVLVQLPRPALGARNGVEKLSGARQRAYVRSLRQEASALISALAARGVKLRELVTFERTWHGFAATVAAKDLSRLQTLGVRVRANRRLFGAFSQPVPAGESVPAPVPGAVAPQVTLLAGGVSGAAGGGYDTTDRDSGPGPGADPRDPSRREVGGGPLAATLQALGARVRVIRVSALRDGEEYARADELLDGLERTVDPDRDGDTSDHDKVALIGVSAPYAGFADAPEAAAVRGARRLGTLVVAPAGDDGRGAGPYGTIGSPGASQGAIAVAPLSNPAAVARTTLRVGNTTVAGAAVLAGTPPSGELRTARPAPADTAAALLVAGDAPLDGRLAIVEAAANPGARVAAAANAGAAAVLLAEPRAGRPLPTVPVGRVAVPVLGVTGPAARSILALRAGTTARATGLRVPRPPLTSGAPSRYASTGPAYDGTAKPDLSRPGSVIAGGELISGSAVAAARVAVEAARLDAADPATAASQLLAPADAAPPPPAPAPTLQIGTPAVTRDKRATSVQLTIGSFDRGDPTAGLGTRVVPADRLVLTLTKAHGGDVAERLTPPGGQRGVLPGVYAYTLPRAVLKSLRPGRYAFSISASAPRQQTPTTQTSAPFEVGG